MAKYYYNGVLLPEVPVDKYTNYPKQIIVKWSNGNIQLIGSKNGLYFNGSTAVYDKNNAALLAYYLNGDTWVEDTNQSGKYSGWTIISNGVSVLQWSNHDILNGSATSTTVYFPATYPMPESATGKCEYNGEEAPSIPVDVLAEYPYIYMTTAKGFAAFSVRPYFYSTSSYPSTLKADGPGVTYNLVDGKWELNESLSSIYIIVNSILWANYNVPNGSEKTINVYFTGSSPVAINYLFGYLIRSGSTLYTVTDGTLSALTETEVTASLFQTYGMNELPKGFLLMGLIDPEVLYWHDLEDELPELILAVIGSPPTPQTVITNTQDMSDSTILGIEGIQAVCSDDILFALSFDDEATWKAYDGTAWITLDLPNTGMTKTTMESIGLEAWAEVVTSDHYKVRFILPTTTSYMTSMVVNYIN